MDNVSPLKVNLTIRKKIVVHINNELQSFGERDSIKSLICIGYHTYYTSCAILNEKTHLCNKGGNTMGANNSK